MNRLKRYSMRGKFTLLVVLSLLLGKITLGIASDGLTSNPEAEKWIFEQIISGKHANLNEQFENEGERFINASFLKYLLVEASSYEIVKRRGINISKAIIMGSLDLEGFNFNYDLKLVNCIFKGPINLSRNRFEGDLFFSGSKFESSAKFYSINVFRTLSLNNAVFLDSVTFSSSVIGQYFTAVNSIYSNNEKLVDFNALKVGLGCSFNEATFNGSVKFSFSQIKQLTANKCNFLNKTKKVTFFAMESDTAFFRNAIFNGPVNFNLINISKIITFDGAKFTNENEGALFQLITVEKVASFIETSFEGPVNFSLSEFKSMFNFQSAVFNNSVSLASCRVSGILESTGAIFNSKVQKVSFNGLLANRAKFNHSIFQGPVDFSLSNFVNNMEVTKAKFLNHNTDIKFWGMKVGCIAILNDSQFEGGVNLGSIYIGSQLDMVGVKFNNQTKKINFSDSTISKKVIFKSTVFSGPVDFSGISAGGIFFENAIFKNEINFSKAIIKNNLQVISTDFLNPNFKASFRDMKIGESLQLADFEFKGGADFGGIEIGDQLLASNVKYANKTENINFNSAKIKGSVLLKSNTFYGSINFKSAKIGYLEISNSKFKSKKSEINLDDIIVDSVIKLHKNVFSGDIFLCASYLSDLWIEGNDQKDTKIIELNLQGSVIKNGVKIKDIEIGTIKLIYSKINSDFSLENVDIKDGAYFQCSNLGSFIMEDVTWPKSPFNTSFVSMDYKYIEIIGQRKKRQFESLLAWINNSIFSLQPYTKLESYFNEMGHTDWASEVYITMRRRQREYLRGWDKFKNWLSDVTLGYGRNPERVWIACLGFILFGWLVLFRTKKKMIQVGGIREYSGFWYSVDSFLPFIDLQLANYWVPKKRKYRVINWLVNIYMFVHSFIGWLLIPIGLLAITGIIK